MLIEDYFHLPLFGFLGVGCFGTLKIHILSKLHFLFSFFFFSIARVFLGKEEGQVDSCAEVLTRSTENDNTDICARVEVRDGER